MNPLISAVLSWTSGTDTWSTGHLNLNASKRTQQQTRYLSPMMVCSSYKKGSGHSFALHPSQKHVSQPARNVIRSAARFRLRVHTLRFERHGIKVIPPSETCVILIMSKMSSMFFSTAPISTRFSPQEICISVSPNRSSQCVYFLEPEQ